MDTEGRSKARAIRWPAAPSDSSRLGRRGAHAPARPTGPPRGDARLLRPARAASASVLATTAATRNTTSATQFSPSAIVNWPVGGMWKKLNAAALRTAVPSPIQTPQ